jgi:hypothetical protein
VGSTELRGLGMQRLQPCWMTHPRTALNTSCAPCAQGASREAALLCRACRPIQALDGPENNKVLQILRLLDKGRAFPCLIGRAAVRRRGPKRWPRVRCRERAPFHLYGLRPTATPQCNRPAATSLPVAPAKCCGRWAQSYTNPRCWHSSLRAIEMTAALLRCSCLQPVAMLPAMSSF